MFTDINIYSISNKTDHISEKYIFIEKKSKTKVDIFPILGRILSRIRIRYFTKRIRGSGSISKWNGSATLLIRQFCHLVFQFHYLFLLLVVWLYVYMSLISLFKNEMPQLIICVLSHQRYFEGIYELLTSLFTIQPDTISLVI